MIYLDRMRVLNKQKTVAQLRPRLILRRLHTRAAGIIT